MHVSVCVYVRVYIIIIVGISVGKYEYIYLSRVHKLSTISMYVIILYIQIKNGKRYVCYDSKKNALRLLSDMETLSAFMCI